MTDTKPFTEQQFASDNWGHLLGRASEEAIEAGDRQRAEELQEVLKGVLARCYSCAQAEKMSADVSVPKPLVTAVTKALQEKRLRVSSGSSSRQETHASLNIKWDLPPREAQPEERPRE